MTEQPEDSVVVPFPGPRVRPDKAKARPRNLGLTPLSKAAGPVAVSARGHWCDRCEGIWYSYFGEGRCPVCGGRC
jgi:hypothetical protein